MTEMNDDQPTTEEMVKVLKQEDFQKVDWVETSIKRWVRVERTDVFRPWVDVHHPGIVRFLGNGGLAIVGDDLPLTIISASGWRSVTTVDYHKEDQND